MKKEAEEQAKKKVFGKAKKSSSTEVVFFPVKLGIWLIGG